MKWCSLIAVFLVGALALAQTPGTAQTTGAAQPSRRMALTFDDLPFVADAEHGTKQILAVLKAHRAPAIGFVIEEKLKWGKGRVALLQQWLDAGMTLGNHTYSHPDFNGRTVEQFEQEILKGEVVTRRLMAARKLELRYFRHPMTHTGDTREKKEALETFLAEHGYRIAPHTIENSDFIFTVPYSLALGLKDDAQLKRLRDAYLDFTLAATEFAEKISPQIFGREVTQTVLLHENAINADCLDEMLKRFEARGYRFVTLDEAMADPAYQTKDNLVASKGPTWLWRWMKSLGMNVSFAEDPEPPKWVVDLYDRR